MSCFPGTPRAPYCASTPARSRSRRSTSAPHEATDGSRPNPPRSTPTSSRLGSSQAFGAGGQLSGAAPVQFSYLLDRQGRRAIMPLIRVGLGLANAGYRPDTGRVPSVRCPVLVGREAELAVLTSALRQAQAGAGGIV